MRLFAKETKTMEQFKKLAMTYITSHRAEYKSTIYDIDRIFANRNFWFYVNEMLAQKNIKTESFRTGQDAAAFVLRCYEEF